MNDQLPNIQKIKMMAVEDHKQYPQYRGHYAGPEWIRVQVKEDVITKSGLVFVAGDVTIAKVEEKDVYHCWVAYSWRQKIDVSLGRGLHQATEV